MNLVLIKIIERYEARYEYLRVDTTSNPVNLKQIIVQHLKKKKNGKLRRKNTLKKY